MATKLFFMYLGAKEKIQNFIKKEKGGSEIIAIVIVIAIVLVLAGVFWTNIQTFFDELWTKVTGKNPIDNIK